MSRNQLKKRILWITQTAILTALLVVFQAITASFGNQFVTGSVMNMMLIIAVMTCGPATGLTVAALSPVIALFLGMNPFAPLIPFIIAGNITLVLVWYLIGNRFKRKKYLVYVAALITAAIAKFLVLYVGIVQIAVPFLFGIPEKQATVIVTMFSFPQLITASIGGVLAILIFPSIKKITDRRHQ